LEQSADRIAAVVRGALAETGEKLGAAGTASLSKDELALVIKDDGVRLAAGGPLLYEPAPPPEAEASPNLFADAELMEFAQNQPTTALAEYHRLAASTNAAIRAGALLREARVLGSLGREQESYAAYLELSQTRGVRVAGAPADLVARLALGDASIKTDLLRGRWSGQFQFYWAQVAPQNAGGEAPPAESVALAEAAQIAFAQRFANPSDRGHQTVWVGSRPFVLLWRGPVDRRAILIAQPESFLKSALADSIPPRTRMAGSYSARRTAQAALPWSAQPQRLASPGPSTSALAPPPRRPLSLPARSISCSGFPE
jgi:hypothetical protein